MTQAKGASEADPGLYQMMVDVKIEFAEIKNEVSQIKTTLLSLEDAIVLMNGGPIGEEEVISAGLVERVQSDLAVAKKVLKKEAKKAKQAKKAKKAKK
jgi:enoyl-CoA hydratase/carnithine racemase